MSFVVFPCRVLNPGAFSNVRHTTPVFAGLVTVPRTPLMWNQWVAYEAAHARGVGAGGLGDVFSTAFGSPRIRLGATGFNPLSRSGRVAS
jgi:hypothetical protein